MRHFIFRHWGTGVSVCDGSAQCCFRPEQCICIYLYRMSRTHLARCAAFPGTGFEACPWTLRPRPIAHHSQHKPARPFRRFCRRQGAHHISRGVCDMSSTCGQTPLDSSGDRIAIGGITRSRTLTFQLLFFAPHSRSKSVPACQRSINVFRSLQESSQVLVQEGKRKRSESGMVVTGDDSQSGGLNHNRS